MKIRQLIAALALGSTLNLAYALDIKPYSAQDLANLQQAGQTVALHFHADWCSSCKAQERVFKGWQGDASVPGTLLVVNYDKEKELRQKMGVRMQSTVIVFKGNTEKSRLAGDSKPEVLRAALAAGQ